MVPLILLGFTALVGGMAFNNAAFQSPTLTPAVSGWDTRKIAVIAGIGAAALGPAWLGAIGLGLAVSALTNFNTMSLVDEGLKAIHGKEGEANAKGPLQLPINPLSLLLSPDHTRRADAPG